MEKKFITEVEGRYIRQASTLGHYAVVKIQIYTIDTEKIIFENYCTPEQLPEKFISSVEKCVLNGAIEFGNSGILVCLTDAKWHQNDSKENDFYIATLIALWKVFPSKK